MTLKQTIVQYSIQNADIHNEKAWQEGHKWLLLLWTSQQYFVGCDRSLSELQRWRGVSDLRALVKLLWHLSRFYREAQSINSQVKEEI